MEICDFVLFRSQVFC